jgi:exonuclease SbcD
MSTTIILGDVHLGKGTSIGKAGIGANLNSRIVDQMNLLDWVLDRASEHSANEIIITGDIFEEPNPSANLITLFISWLMKCQAHEINVHIIIGNHDILRSGSTYYSPLDIITESNIENVYVYKHADTVFVGNFAYTLIPFRDRKSFNSESNADALLMVKEMLAYELAGIPISYKKILIGHLAIEGSIPVGDEIDDMTNELFCPVSMFAGYDYVWMGHVHKPQVMSSNPYVAHIGSMDLSNFGESDHEKHIVVIDQDSDKIFFKEKIPTRKLKKISITIPKDTEDTTDFLIKELEKMDDDFDKSIVKLDIALASSDMKSIDKKKISKLLANKGVYNIATFSESKKINVVKKDVNNTIDNSFDVAAAIKKYGELHVNIKVRDKYMQVANEIFSDYKSALKDKE